MIQLGCWKFFVSKESVFWQEIDGIIKHKWQPYWKLLKLLKWRQSKARTENKAMNNCYCETFATLYSSGSIKLGSSPVKCLSNKNL